MQNKAYLQAMFQPMVEIQSWWCGLSVTEIVARWTDMSAAEHSAQH